jgi:hypothetical protein
MRWIGCLLVVLAALGWLACEVGLSEPPSAAGRELAPWRRTQFGWEKASWLTPQVPVRRPALHPGLIALFEILVSTAALIAFPTQTEGIRTENGSERHVPRKVPRRHGKRDNTPPPRLDAPDQALPLNKGTSAPAHHHRSHTERQSGSW